MKRKEQCDIKRCRNKGDINYYDKLICNRCWEKYSEKPVDVLKKALQINEKRSI